MAEKDLEPIGMAQSLKAASSKSGYSEAVLKRAKAEGCPAFIGSRVNVDDLIAWVESNTHVLQMDPVSKLEYDTKLIKKKQAQYDYEKQRGLHIPLDLLKPALMSNQAHLKSILQKALCQELPQKGAMQDAPSLRELGEQLMDGVCEAMQKGVESWMHD